MARVECKLLAVDLDGTLLDPTGVPHEADVRALQELAARGVPVTIVTGRLYSGTRPTAEIVGIRGPVGCVDGSQLVSTETHRTLFHHGFYGDTATKLRDAMAPSGAALFLFAQDQVVHDAQGAPYLDYVSTWSTAILATRSVSSHAYWADDAGVTALVAVGSAGQIHDAVLSIQSALGDEAQVASFPTRRMENMWGMVVRAAGGNKGSALRWLAEHHRIRVEETVCVGDWMNDLPMFEVAGRSFAMGQAPDAVKAAATDRLEETGYEGGGVARAVRLAFGGKG